MKQQEALKKLQRQIDRMRSVRAILSFGASFTKWKRDTLVAIREVFGEHSSHISDFSSISYHPKDPGLKTGLSTKEEAAAEQRAYEEGT